MVKLSNIKMKPKLIGAFLIVGLLPLLVSSWISLRKSERALEKQSYNLLEAVRTIKQNQVQLYFRSRMTLLDDVQKNVRFTGGLKAFSDAFKQGMDSREYKTLLAEREGGFTTFKEVFGFYDIFLIDPDGNVVYTFSKESDIGANLKTGPLSNSGLARVFNNSKNGNSFEDFSYYEPSKDAAAFIATPIRDASGMYIGSVAFQLSQKQINEIMQERSGMGETGETFLVGQDKRMRSDNLEDNERIVSKSFLGTVEKNGYDTEYVSLALAGKTGIMLSADVMGDEVLCAYSPVEISGVTWAVLAVMNMDEVDKPINALMKSIIIVVLFCSVLIIGIALWIATGITKPLQKVIEFVNAFGKGDLTQTLMIDNKDEIGEMAGGLKTAVNNLRTILEELSISTDTLSSASEELSAVSSQMASSAEEMNSQSGTVAAATEQISANVGTVASAAEQSSSVVANIAAMTEEMSSTFQNIAGLANGATERVSNMSKMGKAMSDGVTNVATAIEEMSASFSEVAKNTSQASKISQAPAGARKQSAKR